VISGVLTTYKWIEVKTDDVTRRACRRLGIDFQRVQEVWMKYFRLTPQGHVRCSLIPRFVNEWDVPVVILLDELATGRAFLGLGRHLRDRVRRQKQTGCEPASSTDTPREFAHWVEL